MPSPQPKLAALLLLLFAAPACKPEPAPTTPEPAPTSEPAPAPELAAEPEPEPEPPPPDHSALIAALDALDAAIEGCHGQLGSKKASACSDAVSAAVAGLADPVQSSTMATDLASGHQEIQTHADKLGKSVKDHHKHKDQHHHLDELARLSKDMRAKVPQ